MSYIVPCYGPKAGPAIKALRFAETLARESRTAVDIVLLCHAKRHFFHGVVWTAVEKDSLLKVPKKRFSNGEKIALSNHASLRLESLPTVRRKPAPNIVVVVNSDEQLLNSLSCFEEIDAIIAVAVTVTRISEWTKKSAAVLPGSPKRAKGALEDYPVASEALWALSYMVDHSNGWANRHQEDLAVELLWSFYTRGCRPDPAEIQKWASLNGWSEAGTVALGETARTVAENLSYPAELGDLWWPDTFSMLKQLLLHRLLHGTDQAPRPKMETKG